MTKPMTTAPATASTFSGRSMNPMEHRPEHAAAEVADQISHEQRDDAEHLADDADPPAVPCLEQHQHGGSAEESELEKIR